MPIQVFVADEQSDRPVEPSRWADLAERVLGDLTQAAGDFELNVSFVDAATMASMNAGFLGREGPTDVLSFPIEDDLPGLAALRRGAGVGDAGEGLGDAGLGREAGGPVLLGDAGLAREAGPPVLLGDVVICPAIAASNAPDHAGSFADEVALLVVHGILHLYGMDHEADDEATEMEALEQVLLDRHFRAVRGVRGVRA